jgi:hypothetical protein
MKKFNMAELKPVSTLMSSVASLGPEGPKKATRGGVNGSQSKFLTEIWPVSQNQPGVPLY